MTFLDKPVSDLSLAELQRLIRQEVSAQVPPLPAGLLALADLDKPLVPPDTPTNAWPLVYSAAQGQFISSGLSSASTVTDAITPTIGTVTVQAGPGFIRASWAAAGATADPCQYKVYIRSGSAPTTADATYLIGTTTALGLVMNTIADGTTQIQFGTTYHVKVIAVSMLSGGGTSAASADATGTPAAIDGVVTTFTNIAAGTITAGDIASARMTTNFLTAAQATITTLSSIVANIGTITSGTIQGTTIQTAATNNARMVLDSTSLRSLAADNSTIWAISATTGLFTGGATHASLGTDLGSITAGTITGATVRTASSGQRVVLDTDGVHLYDSATPATLIVDIPTDSTKSAYFAGNISSGSVTLTGTSNQIAQSGKLQLSGGVSQPLTVAALAKNSTAGSLSTSTTYYVSYSWAHVFDTVTATMTIATPAVITATISGTKAWAVGDPVVFTTTGALPTGIVSGTVYYIKTVVSATTFQIAATRGGAAINTTGSQSGVHTLKRYVETQPAPVASIGTGTGTSIQVTIPAAPTGADLAMVYVNTATFGSGGGHFQSSVSPLTISNSATTTTVFSTYASGGSTSGTANTFQTTAAGGTVSGGAQIYPGYPTDTSGNDYSWRLEGNGRIRFVGPTINVQYWMYEEFLGAVLPAAGTPGGVLGSLIETASGTAAGIVVTGSTNVNPGVIQLNTGSTNAGSDLVRGGAGVITVGVARIRFSAYVNFDLGVPTALQKYQCMIGLTDVADASTAATTAHLIGFTFVSTGDSGNFGLRCTNAGSNTSYQQAVDSTGANVTLTTGWHLLDFEVNPAGTSVAWWLDGVPQTAVTTNIPTVGLRVQAGITRTGTGATARSLSVDVLSLYGDFVS